MRKINLSLGILVLSSAYSDAQKDKRHNEEGSLVEVQEHQSHLRQSLRGLKGHEIDEILPRSLSEYTYGDCGGGPTLKVPFAASARDDCVAYRKVGDAVLGRCGNGFLDAQSTTDATCVSRGAQCNIGFTKSGEWIEYSFETLEGGGEEEEAYYDITVRVASHSKHQKLQLTLDGNEYGNSSGGFRQSNKNDKPHKHVFKSTPGEGWQEFRDMTWENVLLSKGSIYQLFVEFITGHVNICTISITKRVVVETPNLTVPSIGYKESISHSYPTP